MFGFIKRNEVKEKKEEEKKDEGDVMDLFAGMNITTKKKE